MTDLNRIKKLSGIEQVKELNSKNILATMPFMKAIKQYVAVSYTHLTLPTIYSV